MNLYPEHELVKKCLLQIEDRLAWGKPADWHNDVFIELSELIYTETNVLLSPTTLKRVWGKVNYSNKPSISTLNALSQFAGYHNWRDFKIQWNVKNPNWIERRINPNLGIIVTSAAMLTLVFVSLFSMIGIRNNSNIDVSKIEFSSHTVANGIPNSVVFDFNLKGIRSDSIYIQQFWDVTKTIQINSEQNQATGIYYYPGYFRSKLIIDGEIIKEHDLFIKSNGWLATVDYEPIPKYIKQLNALSLPKEIILEIKNSEQKLTSTYHYVDNFKDVSGDNFILNTTLKNVYNEKWAVCQNVVIFIIGTKSAHMIPFAISGCASKLGLMMSDVYLDGKKKDLSSLCLDLTSSKDLQIKVKDKHLSVIENDKILFTGSYKKSIGRIVGIRYRFLGAGEVENIKLSSLGGNPIIIDENLENNPDN